MNRHVSDAIRIGLTIIIAVIACYILYDPARRTQKEYKQELLEGHKTVRAYVYRRIGTKNRNTIEYIFSINNKEYLGESRYSRSKPYPDDGDSIVVFYKENNPEINLWSGCFD